MLLLYIPGFLPGEEADLPGLKKTNFWRKQFLGFWDFIAQRRKLRSRKNILYTMKNVILPYISLLTSALINIHLQFRDL